MASKPKSPAPSPQETIPPDKPPTPNADGTLIQYGPSVRMERAEMLPSGSYVWHVYALEPVTDGTHPVSGEATTDVAVWTKEGEGDEASARKLCESLSGITS